MGRISKRGSPALRKTLFLIIPAEEGDDNLIGAWEYDRGYLWKNRVFSRVVFLRVSAKGSASVLKAIEEIARSVYAADNIRTLTNDSGEEGLLKLIRRGY